MAIDDSEECAFCDQEAMGAAIVIDADTGERVTLMLCETCGKQFQVPPGTLVEMPPTMNTPAKLLN